MVAPVYPAFYTPNGYCEKGPHRLKQTASLYDLPFRRYCYKKPMLPTSNIKQPAAMNHRPDVDPPVFSKAAPTKRRRIARCVPLAGEVACCCVSADDRSPRAAGRTDYNGYMLSVCPVRPHVTGGRIQPDHAGPQIHNIVKSSQVYLYSTIHTYSNSQCFTKNKNHSYNKI